MKLHELLQQIGDAATLLNTQDDQDILANLEVIDGARSASNPNDVMWRCYRRAGLWNLIIHKIHKDDSPEFFITATNGHILSANNLALICAAWVDAVAWAKRDEEPTKSPSE